MGDTGWSEMKYECGAAFSQALKEDAQQIEDHHAVRGNPCMTFTMLGDFSVGKTMILGRAISECKKGYR
eukprot:gene2592-2066_t